VMVSARAVYSKYSMEPASPIDFGAMIKGTKKKQIVMLENKGLLPFKFYIYQAPTDASLEAKVEHTPCWGAQGTAVGHQPLLELFLQATINLGMFSVSPCSGSLTPLGRQKITMECLAGQVGTYKEQLYIDITGR
ncbi:HYDIN protein, partial [Pardalotus punctatus]|nr:HYDIN protein [Pardalotus punctatus]